MIQHGILDLDAIYDMLGPEDSLIQEDAEKDISEAREFIRSGKTVKWTIDHLRNRNYDQFSSVKYIRVYCQSNQEQGQTAHRREVVGK